MLKTKAILARKTDEFRPQECVIEKVIGLASQEYDAFSRDMLSDYDFIKDNIDLMYADRQGVYHCLLVIGEDRPDGILIESEGSSYARYAAFLPNAVSFLAGHQKQQQAEKQRPSAPSLKLRELMSVPLEDIHLVHSDEDIEPATITELKCDTLTQAGQEEWKEVLDADVARIFHGIYGVQVECGGVDPQRLADFSLMLAGYCSEQDYEKWVGREPESPDIKINL